VTAIARLLDISVMKGCDFNKDKAAKRQQAVAAQVHPPSLTVLEQLVCHCGFGLPTGGCAHPPASLMAELLSANRRETQEQQLGAVYTRAVCKARARGKQATQLELAKLVAAYNAPRQGSHVRGGPEDAKGHLYFRPMQYASGLVKKKPYQKVVADLCVIFAQTSLGHTVQPKTLQKALQNMPTEFQSSDTQVQAIAVEMDDEMDVQQQPGQSSSNT